MALTPNNDSYVTIPDAYALLADRLYLSDWVGALDSDKERALRQACLRLDRVEWLGAIADDSQLHAWPRQGVVDQEGRSISPATVPTAIKRAQVELALALLRRDLTLDSDTLGLRRRSVGAGSAVVTLEWDGSAPQRTLPDEVMALIRPFVRFAPTSTSTRLVP